MLHLLVESKQNTSLYRSECQCGNQQPSKLSKVNNTSCNSTCSGNNKLTCGGKWKMEIYSTGITSNDDLLFYIL